MKRPLFFVLAIAAGLLINLPAQNQPSDPLSRRYSFGNARDGKLFKALALLDEDSIDRSLAASCILGISHDELNQNKFPQLETRLEKLISSGIIKLSEGKYYLTFPVILGKKRELMYDLAWKKAMTLLPEAEPIFSKLRKELGSRQEMAFHIFSCRIVNELFYELWKSQFPDETSGPSEIWLIYPQHPFMVGSEFIELESKGELAISWNSHCQKDFQDIRSYPDLLYSTALNNSESIKKNDLLDRYGFTTETGMKKIFYYTQGDQLDKLCIEFTNELLPAFKTLYDYKNLSKTFEISEKEIFLIVLHETVYSLFENLQQLNKMELPLALRNDTNSMSMVQLVSFKLNANK